MIYFNYYKWRGAWICTYDTDTLNFRHNIIKYAIFHNATSTYISVYMPITGQTLRVGFGFYDGVHEYVPYDTDTLNIRHNIIK